MRTAWLLLALVFVTHSISPVATSADSRWTVPLALSLLKRGDADLNEYPKLLEQHQYYGVECIDPAGLRAGPAAKNCSGSYHSSYPIGGPLLATPFVLIVERASQAFAFVAPGIHTGRPMLDALLAGDVVTAYGAVEVIVASFFIAMCATMIYVIARRFLRQQYAVALALIFAYSTPAWSTGSRAFWQHCPSMLVLTLVVYLFIRAESNPVYAAIAGAPLACSYVIRPTNSLLVIVATLYVVFRHRKQLIPYLLFAAPILASFLLYNFAVYRELLPPYYRTRPAAFDPRGMLTAATGLLVSPSRGLLVFMPATVFSVWGMVLAVRTRWLHPLNYFLIVWAALHFLLITFFHQLWIGGFSYGPRLLVDVVPVLVLFLIPVLARIQERDRWWRLTEVAMAVCIAFGVFVHGRGAWRFPTQQWNQIPISIDVRPERVWDWSDPQFLR
jgi:hypothetical protein